MERALAELTEDELDLKLLDDEYASALRELAEAKRDAGRDVVEIEEAPPEDEQESADVIDIMAVLKERMSGAAQARAQSRLATQRPAATRRRSRRAERHEQEGALRARRRSSICRAEAACRARISSRRCAKRAGESIASERRASSNPCHGSRLRARISFGTSSTPNAAPAGIGLELVPFDRQRDGRAGACAGEYAPIAVASASLRR